MSANPTAAAVLAVAELFESRHWQYGGGDGMFVPDAEKLTHTIRDLETAALAALAEDPDEKWAEIESGRFMVRATRWSSDTIRTELFLSLGAL